MRWDAKAKLGEVEGFSLALNYTADDRRRQEWERGRQEGWNNSIHCRSYLSSLNRCQPGCSLYCSTKAFWQKTHRHAHTSFWANQCILVSVISLGALQFSLLGEQGDSQGGEKLLRFALPFIARVCFLLPPLLIFAYLYFSSVEWQCILKSCQWEMHFSMFDMFDMNTTTVRDASATYLELKEFSLFLSVLVLITFCFSHLITQLL